MKTRKRGEGKRQEGGKHGVERCEKNLKSRLKMRRVIMAVKEKEDLLQCFCPTHASVCVCVCV